MTEARAWHLFLDPATCIRSVTLACGLARSEFVKSLPEVWPPKDLAKSAEDSSGCATHKRPGGERSARLMFSADELAAAMRSKGGERPLPAAASLLRAASASSTNLCDTEALADQSVTLMAPSPGLSSPDLAGSRLARRWMRGIMARELARDLADEEEWNTPSMLDLTQLCAPNAEPSPTSVVPLDDVLDEKAGGALR